MSGRGWVGVGGGGWVAGVLHSHNVHCNFLVFWLCGENNDVVVSIHGLFYYGSLV